MASLAATISADAALKTKVLDALYKLHQDKSTSHLELLSVFENVDQEEPKYDTSHEIALHHEKGEPLYNSSHLENGSTYYKLVFGDPDEINNEGDPTPAARKAQEEMLDLVLIVKDDKATIGAKPENKKKYNVITSFIISEPFIRRKHALKSFRNRHKGKGAAATRRRRSRRNSKK